MSNNPTIEVPQVNAAIKQAKAEAANGTTWSRLGEWLDEIKVTAVAALMGESGTGAEKKAYVLSVIAYLFDVIAPNVYLPIWAEPFRFVITPIAKQVILALADGGIEVIYRRLKEGSVQ